MIEKQREESGEWLKSHRSSACTSTPLTAKQLRALRFKAQTDERIAKAQAEENRLYCGD